MTVEWSFPILILFSSWLVCKNVAPNCITWDVIKDDLTLIYKTDDVLKPLTLKDNKGNKTMCSFEKLSYHCHGIPTFGVIHPNINRKEIIFTIEDAKNKDVDGTWYISQGGKTFNTTVSFRNGFIGSTDIYITGEVDMSKVTVRCFACRAPYGYNVEFLINDRSEDSLTLNYTTGKCTHQTGECNPEICSCNPSGNEFSRSFYLQNTSQTVNLSCDMMFVDLIAPPFFSKYATFVYDGTDVHSKETKTKKNLSETSNKTKDNTKEDFTGPLIAIVILDVIFITAIVVVLIVLDKKLRTKNNDNTPVPHRQEEAVPLCSKITQSSKHVQSVKGDNAPEINTQVEENVIGIENYQVDKNVHKSEEKSAPRMNYELVHQMTYQGEKYITEEERTTANDIVQKLQEESDPQLSNEVVGCITRKESNQANEIVQQLEEVSYIDHIKSEDRPNPPARPLDVVFINFDVTVERKWVERVVKMLEEQFDLVCGLIGRDFMIGLQTDDSFNFIEKHTPVVVTFSEKSCKRQHEIRLIENIDKIVAVMVEVCSPPIISINMKCVDATLDEEQWLKQLFTALNIKKK